MEFENSFNELANNIKERKNLIKTEEATKMAFIIPFLKILGYDVYNPNIVIPEYTADIGNKKGEKVDYAILKDSKPFILIEAKNHTENLDNHNNQLIRYFNACTDVKFAILTNGIEYRFFTDIEEKNLMDKTPFLLIDLEKPKQRDFKDLKNFVYSNLNPDEILKIAMNKKYSYNIQEIFKNEIENPSEEFTSFFAKKLSSNKRITNSVLQEFKIHIKRAFKDIINDLAFEKVLELKNNLQEVNNELDESYTDKNKEIITTQEELQAFHYFKSILVDKACADEIFYKDTLQYFTIFYQKSTQWIARLYLGPREKSMVLCNKAERLYIEKLEDLHKFKDDIIKAYESRKIKLS